MSTNRLARLIQAIKQKIPNKKHQSSSDFFFAGGSSVSNVMDAMSSVDPNAPEAEANAHSISDDDGGRIELNQDGTEVIRK